MKRTKATRLAHLAGRLSRPYAADRLQAWKRAWDENAKGFGVSKTIK